MLGIFNKKYVWISLSIIITCGMNIPVWSQTKDKQTRIVVNPQVIQDKVTLRVKAIKDNQLLSNLTEKDFSVYVDCREKDVQQCNPVSLDSWKNPKESTPLPTRIVLLLDLSGSMKEPDIGKSGERGKPKLQGAIDAIEEFREVLAKRGGDSQMVIVPFSDQAQYNECEGDRITDQTLNRFKKASDPQHQDDLAELQNALDNELKYRSQKSTRPANTNHRICGETNLYESLANTLTFLGTTNFQDPKTPGYSQSKPKLHVVLLSDGFNTVPFADSKDKCDRSHFDKLNQEYLQKYQEKIQVHTIGYGRDPAELGKDINYRFITNGEKATCNQLAKFKDKKLREKFESELVDQEHLQQIAEITGGTPQFSGNAQEIAEKLQEILDTILGEYEMTYTQKEADTASEHTVRVVIKSVGQETTSYSLPFVFQVPPDKRIWTILVFIILPLGVGILLLYLLAADIKKQAL